jgi:hypothetical protein
MPVLVLMLKLKLRKMKKPEFHGYVGNIAVLRDGSSVKILGGHNSKLFVKTLDGTIKECYHEDLQYVTEE